MNDSQIIDWMQLHLVSIINVDTDKYFIEYWDNNSNIGKISGCSLRDCVIGAIIRDTKV